MDDLYDRLSFLADEAGSVPEADATDRLDERRSGLVDFHQMSRIRAEQARDIPATSAARLRLMD
ncbi:MAG: hypothetical protein ABI587_16305 [Gemmatimonadales bacterium]